MTVPVSRSRMVQVALVAALAVFPAAAAPAAAQVDETTPKDEFATTRHEVDVGDRNIGYTAYAGLLPLYENDTGKLMARLFVMAYVADRKRGESPRPLTFIWNGGPGASSSQLQLAGFGPQGLETPATYPEWFEDPPDTIADRADTWLAVSDLVFVDPVGTGYSRATGAEYRDLLYSRRGDIEAVAEAIRLYRTRFDAWDQPLFIAGESYGTTRAMGVAEALERRRAGLAGVILISGYYDAGQALPSALATALDVPMYTAAAHYHERLPHDLQALPQERAVAAAEAWARDGYAPALEARDSLSPERRAAIIDGLERYTAIPARHVDAETMALATGTFADRLLEADGLELGRYDYRMARPRREEGHAWVPTRDPSLLPMIDLMQGTFPPAIRYLRHTLAYRSDLLYQGPFGEAFHPRPLTDVTNGAAGDLAGIFSDWMTIKWKRDEPGSGDDAAQPAKRPPLVRAMELNPRFLVWNVKGLYDGSCIALDEAVARTAEHLRRRIRNSCYSAGHMVYSDAAVRQEMKRDFAEFVHDALAARTAGQENRP